MDCDSQCGSPAGMGQLMKYFESQSRRLDRQTFQSCPSLNPDFESKIKFNGVPILPPAMTSSRRDELRQYKKDAVLLEKRLKARHRRELLAKADSLVNQSQVCFPRASSRQAARQLNFDSERQHDEPSSYSHQHDLLSGTRTFSTNAEAETVNDSDDFGLQTLDSVNSDFMSLASESIPKLFSGLVLTSVKEQKISYDLDRLSKALNVQDLESTSGSDLSDTTDLTQTQDNRNILAAKDGNSFQNTVSLEDKFLSQRSLNDSLAQSTNCHHDTHGMLVRELLQSAKQSLESGKMTTSEIMSSGFVEKAELANSEQSHNSHGGSPASGIANMYAPTDGQWSNRSSPKSQKSGVHFASFVTEYINTSTRAEQPTVVKKKMTSDPQSAVKQAHDDKTVLPIILDPSESRKRSLLSHKVFDFENSTGLIDKVSAYTDSSSSPVTPPFSINSHVPFQLYGRSEMSSSDKENDVAQLYKTFQHGQKRSLELANTSGHNLNERVSTESHAYESRQQQIYVEKITGNSGASSMRNTAGDKVTKTSAPHSLVREVGTSSDLLASASNSVTTSDTISVAESTCFIEKPANLGAVSMEKKSVSDSQASTRSNTLTNTSGSSSSTVREELPKDIPAIGMNIVNTDLQSVSMNQGQRQEKAEGIGLKTVKEIQPCQSDSPKKLNVDTSVRDSDAQENVVTPSRNNICRNSYTLSEPSPALIQAHGRPEKTNVKEKNDEQKATVKTDTTISNINQQAVGDHIPHKRMETTLKNTVASESDGKASFLSDAEKEGKAEHINKYLNQVQLQNSMNFTGQSWNTQLMPGDIETDEETQAISAATDDDCHTSVLDVLRSIVESQGSMEKHTVAELLDLHQQQMDEKRQFLIRQQQREMEDLFIQQRRQMMMLDTEIKAVQQQGREQKQFLIQNAPENIKVKSKNGEYSPVQTGNFDSTDIKRWQSKPKPMTETSVNVPGSLHVDAVNQSSSDRHTPVTSSRLKPKANSEIDAKSGKPEQVKPRSYYQSKKNSVLYSSPHSTSDDSQTRVKNTIGDDFYASNASGVRVGGRIPEVSPSVTSPYLRHPLVMRSPQKYTLQRRNERVVVPQEAYLPEMQVKFDKLTAAAKGFLTRCLFKSDKVEELKKTIRDTREFAFSFQTETPIKKGVFTSQDKVLLERIIAQLQAALLDIHEIFFEIPVIDRLLLIEQTRISEQEKSTKASARDNMRESIPKISQATLKALERKRKSREGGASADMNTSRPKTAPARTSSPQHENHIDCRALKPLQDLHHISPIRPDINRPERGPPDFNKERHCVIQPKRIIAMPNRSANAFVGNNTDSQKRGSQKLSVVANKPVLKSKPAVNKPTNRPLKSWK